MKQHCIKNIPHEEVVALADLVQAQPGQVASRTLARNDHVSLTLFAFDKGEEISAHESAGDAMATVLCGEGRFTVDGAPYDVKAGESLVMPARKPHSVCAKEPFKCLLTVVFPREKPEKKKKD